MLQVESERDLLLTLLDWFEDEVEAGDEALQVWVDRIKGTLAVHSGLLDQPSLGS